MSGGRGRGRANASGDAMSGGTLESFDYRFLSLYDAQRKLLINHLKGHLINLIGGADAAASQGVDIHVASTEDVRPSDAVGGATYTVTAHVRAPRRATLKLQQLCTHVCIPHHDFPMHQCHEYARSYCEQASLNFPCSIFPNYGQQAFRAFFIVQGSSWTGADDPQRTSHIAMGGGTTPSQEVIAHVQRFLTHPEHSQQFRAASTNNTQYVHATAAAAASDSSAAPPRPGRDGPRAPSVADRLQRIAELPHREAKAELDALVKERIANGDSEAAPTASADEKARKLLKWHLFLYNAEKLYVLAKLAAYEMSDLVATRVSHFNNVVKVPLPQQRTTTSGDRKHHADAAAMAFTERRPKIDMDSVVIFRIERVPHRWFGHPSFEKVFSESDKYTLERHHGPLDIARKILNVFPLQLWVFLDGEVSDVELRCEIVLDTEGGRRGGEKGSRAAAPKLVLSEEQLTFLMERAVEDALPLRVMFDSRPTIMSLTSLQRGITFTLANDNVLARFFHGVRQQLAAAGGTGRPSNHRGFLTHDEWQQETQALRSRNAHHRGRRPHNDGGDGASELDDDDDTMDDERLGGDGDGGARGRGRARGRGAHPQSQHRSDRGGVFVESLNRRQVGLRAEDSDDADTIARKIDSFLMRSLNDDQYAAAQYLLRPPYPELAIRGPPGTGKTEVVCRAVINLWMRNSSSTFVIAAPSQSAVDVITERLIRVIDQVPAPPELRQRMLESILRYCGKARHPMKSTNLTLSVSNIAENKRSLDKLRHDDRFDEEMVSDPEFMRAKRVLCISVTALPKFLKLTEKDDEDDGGAATTGGAEGDDDLFGSVQVIGRGGRAAAAGRAIRGRGSTGGRPHDSSSRAPLSLLKRCTHVIMDEAGRAQLAHGFQLVRVVPPSANVILLGDPEQIKPFCFAPFAQPWLRDKSLLQYAMDPSHGRFSTIFLNISHRTNSAMVSLLNVVVYNGHLKAAEGGAARAGAEEGEGGSLSPAFRVWPGHFGDKILPARFVHCPGGEAQKKSDEALTTLPSTRAAATATAASDAGLWYNTKTLETAFDYYSSLRAVAGVPASEIRIICEFEHQRHKIKERMQWMKYGGETNNVLSIHDFHGAEVDVIIWVLVRSQPNNMERADYPESSEIGTTISRHRHLLVIIGDGRAYCHRDKAPRKLQRLMNELVVQRAIDGYQYPPPAAAAAHDDDDIVGDEERRTTADVAGCLPDSFCVPTRIPAAHIVVPEFKPKSIRTVAIKQYQDVLAAQGNNRSFCGQVRCLSARLAFNGARRGAAEFVVKNRFRSSLDVVLTGDTVAGQVLTNLLPGDIVAVCLDATTLWREPTMDFFGETVRPIPDDELPRHLGAGRTWTQDSLSYGSAEDNRDVDTEIPFSVAPDAVADGPLATRQPVGTFACLISSVERLLPPLLAWIHHDGSTTTHVTLFNELLGIDPKVALQDAKGESEAINRYVSTARHDGTISHSEPVVVVVLWVRLLRVRVGQLTAVVVGIVGPKPPALTSDHGMRSKLTLSEPVLLRSAENLRSLPATSLPLDLPNGNSGAINEHARFWQSDNGGGAAASRPPLHQEDDTIVHDDGFLPLAFVDAAGSYTGSQETLGSTECSFSFDDGGFMRGVKHPDGTERRATTIRICVPFVADQVSPQHEATAAANILPRASATTPLPLYLTSLFDDDGYLSDSRRFPAFVVPGPPIRGGDKEDKPLQRVLVLEGTLVALTRSNHATQLELKDCSLQLRYRLAKTDARRKPRSDVVQKAFVVCKMLMALHAQFPGAIGEFATAEFQRFSQIGTPPVAVHRSAYRWLTRCLGDAMAAQVLLDALPTRGLFVRQDPWPFATSADSQPLSLSTLLKMDEWYVPHLDTTTNAAPALNASMNGLFPIMTRVCEGPLSYGHLLVQRLLLVSWKLTYRTEAALTPAERSLLSATRLHAKRINVAVDCWLWD